MSILPIHRRIELFPPLCILPSIPKKPKPGEHESICMHLRRLMIMQQRNAIMMRMMTAWNRMTTFLGFGVRYSFHRPRCFDRLA